jgi:hypothetical protein
MQERPVITRLAPFALAAAMLLAGCASQPAEDPDFDKVDREADEAQGELDEATGE